jgi:hypothetical protein
MPKPPAKRPHGSGDRNDNAEARQDRKGQQDRDRKIREGEKATDKAAKRDMGVR